MSIGLLLLRAVIDAGSQTHFGLLTERLFYGEETTAYGIIKEHLTGYGSFPSLDTLNSRGVLLSNYTAVEPVEYYLNRCRIRAKIGIMNTSINTISPLLAGKRVEEAITTLSSAMAEARALDGILHNADMDHQLEFVLSSSLSRRFSSELEGIPMGYDILDRVTEGGAQPGDLVIVVARPNIGKSWMLLKMMQGAWRANHSCLFASMEMSLPAITRRFAGLETGINPNIIRSGRLSHYAIDALEEVRDRLFSVVPIKLLCGSEVSTVGQLDAMIQLYTPDIAYVDSGYLLQPERKRKGSESRRESISDVIEELKAVAVRRNIPIVSTVQFNREVRRTSKKVSLDMAQIAETDVIGRTASVVIGMTGRGNKRTFEIMKNRDGRVGDKFTINFLHEPVDLSFCHEGGVTDEEEDAVESTDVSWMETGRAI
jgi:replicative DNA helicase